MAEAIPETENGFWLFGYGSLIWKPPKHFDQRVPGYIEGYYRRFWQASEDHRGTHEYPGRVVTLIDRSQYESIDSSSPPPSSRVWGVAYHIPREHVREVEEYLDIREMNGYSIQYTPFQPAAHEGDPIEKCMVYIGLPSSPQFMGPQDLDELAAMIWKCRGASGENREYLFMLEESLKELGEGAGDEHVEEVAKRTRQVGMDRGEDGATLENGRSIEAAIENIRSATTSDRRLEEMEKP